MLKSRSIGNLVILSVLAILGTIYFMDVQMLPKEEERIVVETLYYILLFLLVIEAIKSILLLRKKENTVSTTQKSSFVWSTLLKNKQVNLFISLVIYVLVIPLLGFFATSFIYMIFLNYFLNNRKKLQIYLIPILVLSGSYILFVHLLGIRLPSGILI